MQTEFVCFFDCLISKEKLYSLKFNYLVFILLKNVDMIKGRLNFREKSRGNGIMKAVIQNSFLKRLASRNYLIIGAAIVVIAVAQFVLQIAFIQKENLRAVETSASDIKPLDQPVFEKEKNPVAEEYQPEKTNVPMNAPKAVKTVVRRRVEVAPTRITPKKREVRETRAERLRRAEKLLTGI